MSIYDPNQPEEEQDEVEVEGEAVEEQFSEQHRPLQSPRSRRNVTVSGRNRTDLGQSANIMAQAAKAATQTNAQYHLTSLGIPEEIADLVLKTAQENSMEEVDVIKLGIILVALARKAQQQGLRLGVIDSKGSLVSELLGI